MTYDTWKTTELQQGVGVVCDGCRLVIDECVAEWIGTDCLCPRCAHQKVEQELTALRRDRDAAARRGEHGAALIINDKILWLKKHGARV